MRHTRRAFSLVELLIVIGIVTLLLSLLIPAVQLVRAAWDRVACQAKLRQLGIALHQYHLDQGHLPAGFVPPASGQRYPYLSWLARTLPYLSQDPLWRDIDAAYRLDPYPFHQPPHHALGRPVQAFQCPGDERVKAQQVTHEGYLVGLTSYAGVNGINMNTQDGVLYRLSKVKFSDVRDGMSSTLMVGERPPGPDFWLGWWYVSGSNGLTGSPEFLLGAQEINQVGKYDYLYCPPGPYRFSKGRWHYPCSIFHFWSPHPSGANFLMVDGSVHLLKYTAREVLPALATRAGGEVPIDLD